MMQGCSMMQGGMGEMMGGGAQPRAKLVIAKLDRLSRNQQQTHSRAR
jgi:hypothetical protein